MAIIGVAPCAVLPEALNNIRCLQIILGVAILARRLAREFGIEHITTTLQYEAPALEVLGCSILLLILALRVCAYLYDFY